MHQRLPIGITKIFRLIATGLMAISLFAHGNFDHVVGTVVKMENQTVTVHTAKGDVDVKLDAKTEVTKEDHKFTPSDLKAGMRVVIDVEKGSKTAHSVKVGVQAAH